MDHAIGLAILSALVGAAFTYGLCSPRASISGLSKLSFDAPRKGAPGYRKYMRALRKG